MPRNNIFQKLTRQYKFAVQLVAMWEASGLMYSGGRRPFLRPFMQEMKLMQKTQPFLFSKGACLCKSFHVSNLSVNIRRRNILITVR